MRVRQRIFVWRVPYCARQAYISSLLTNFSQHTHWLPHSPAIFQPSEPLIYPSLFLSLTLPEIKISSNVNTFFIYINMNIFNSLAQYQSYVGYNHIALIIFQFLHHIFLSEKWLNGIRKNMSVCLIFIQTTRCEFPSLHVLHNA